MARKNQVYSNELKLEVVQAYLKGNETQKNMKFKIVRRWWLGSKSLKKWV